MKHCTLFRYYIVMEEIKIVSPRNKYRTAAGHRVISLLRYDRAAEYFAEPNRETEPLAGDHLYLSVEKMVLVGEEEEARPSIDSWRCRAGPAERGSAAACPPHLVGWSVRRTAPRSGRRAAQGRGGRGASRPLAARLSLQLRSYPRPRSITCSLSAFLPAPSSLPHFSKKKKKKSLSFTSLAVGRTRIRRTALLFF